MNGNSQLSRPISVQDKGKIVLSNTCSIDSIISILATPASNSGVFWKYLSEIRLSNLTANIVLQMKKK